ncbi:hypothetical protein ACFYW6_39060 [Streptomyces sp. NPDC002659]|uniref:hypothetical protein n=1 Tax=Streptomyces sp. NPDC002659 TaxID=3364656 RepID=UPI0036B9E73D
MRFDRKGRTRNIIQVLTAFAAATALLLGLSSPAGAAEGTGNFRVIIWDVKFGFPYLNDCGAFSSDCNAAEIYGTLGATTTIDPYGGRDYYNIGGKYPNYSPISIHAGYMYYPSQKGAPVSANGYYNNVMQFKAQGGDRVEVYAEFWDDDGFSSDDVLCQGDDFPSVFGFNVYDTWTKSLGGQYVSQTYTTADRGEDDGFCRVSYKARVERIA